MDEQREVVTWLTPMEVAERLQVSKYTVIRLFKKQELPAEKIGHQWRLREEYLNEKHCKAAS